MSENRLKDILEPRFPGLLQEMKDRITAGERQYNAAAGQPGSGFLWEHTVQVAHIAARLAAAEQMAPLLPVLGALFHDTGKFVGGTYHAELVAEEEHAVRLVRRLMPPRGLTAVETETVALSLRALYCEDRTEGPLTGIIHDADFLSKCGCLGVAAFFTKAALRQMPLREALSRWLSKEFTYARAAARILRTAAGRKMAAEKAGRTEQFFRDLLAELHQWGIAEFTVETRPLADAGWVPSPRVHPATEIVLVLPARCPTCGEAVSALLETEQGVKCQKLVARIGCDVDHDGYEMTFCLPEIAP
ncbi:MAG: HD domain-containing protein [Acidobacteria bacterium]|nr:HD domain-containing protein [Acidobacteriota bacterium]